jgi:hypothetical protein
MLRKETTMVNRLDFKRITAFSIAFTAFVLLSAGLVGTAQGQVFTGTIDVDTDDDGRIVEAYLEVDELDGSYSIQIALDDRTRKLIDQYQGMTVQITGEVVENDGDEYLKVKSCLLVVCGEVLCEHDDNDRLEAVFLECSESFDTYTLKIDANAKKLASEMDGKAVRALGTIVSKEDEEFFVLDSYAELIAGRGCFKVSVDDDGNVTSVRFACEGDEDPVTYDLKLDDQAIDLAERFEADRVELTGTLSRSGKTTLLTVLTCELCEDEEDED